MINEKQNTETYSEKKTEFQNEITIFVIPALSQIDWTNPAMLFKTTLKCFFKAIIARNLYTIGHTIARIKSPRTLEPVYVAMSGKFHTEKVTSVLLKKMGFGVLGATLKGHIEPQNRIHKGIKLYGKRGKIAYIRFKVNEQSIDRVFEFVERFENKSKLRFAPCELYNGATWPRYENEGSGCSSFGMALLDVAGILPPGSEDWKANVLIPMNIIGGEFNQNKKIKVRTILKTTSWYTGEGVEDVDFVRYSVYDPEKIFKWIKACRTQNEFGYIAEDENGIAGLQIDMSYVQITEPVFLQRTVSNLFIKHYYEDLNDLMDIDAI